tara:strand:- start:52 stop:183 length:132 start_codon:yes stop_codon:yes gene_type:complete
MEYIATGEQYGWGIERRTGLFDLAFEACQLGIEITVPTIQEGN